MLAYELLKGEYNYQRENIKITIIILLSHKLFLSYSKEKRGSFS